MDEIARKLNVDLKVGLKDQAEADSREADFGTNKRDLMKPKPCYMFLKEQLSDIMLIILIFAAILSLVLNFATASPDEYKLGKLVLTLLSTALALKCLVEPVLGSFSDPDPLKNKINYNLFSLDRWYCHSYCSHCCLWRRLFCRLAERD